MNAELLAWADHLVSAGLNGLYQGIIVTGLVALSLRRSRSNAATRHAAWFATLILVTFLIPAHAWRLRSSPGIAPSTAASNPAESLPEPEPLQAGLEESSSRLGVDPQTAPEIPAATEDDGLLAAGERFLFPQLDEESLSPGFEPGAEPDRSEVANATQPIIPVVAPSEGEPFRLAALARAAGRILNPVSLNFGLGKGPWRFLSLVLAAFWCGVTSLGLTVLFQRLYRIRRLKRAAAPPDSSLLNRFEQLKRVVRPNRPVELRVFSGQQSPLVLGFLHPVILLPVGLPAVETEQILRHELAHVCRRDDWANLVQHFIGAILFFHPAVWWIARQLSLEREIACDDHVLRQSGRPRAYALLLANLAGRVHGQPALLAPGASTNKSQLQQRIDMILNPNRNASPRLAKTRLGLITAAAALMATLALYAGPRVVLAPPADAAPPAPASGDSSPSAPAGLAVAAFNSEAPAPVAAEGSPPSVVVWSTDAKGWHADTLVAPTALPAPGPVPAPHPVAVVPPTPPSIAVAQNDLRPPRPPRPARVDGEDRSLEARLDRLEKMVESLLAQQGPKMKTPEFNFKGFEKPGGPLDPKQLDQIKEFAKKQADFDRKRMELDRHAADQLKDVARHAEEDARRSLKESEHGPKMELRARIHAHGKNAQLEALRRQLEALEHQKQALSRQIERLERQKPENSQEEELDEEISLSEDEATDAE